MPRSEAGTIDELLVFPMAAGSDVDTQRRLVRAYAETWPLTEQVERELHDRQLL